MKVAMLQVEDRTDPYLEVCILRNKLYCSKYGIDHVMIRRGLEEYPPYWWKVVYLYKLMLENKHDVVVWMDSDAFVYDDNRDVRSFFTESSDSMLICPDPPSWGSDFMAAVFMIKNNDKGKEIIKKWLSYYNPFRWMKVNEKWYCNGPWAGIDYEQGSFAKLILPEYKNTIKTLPWYTFHEIDCIEPHTNTWSIHIPTAVKYKRYLCESTININENIELRHVVIFVTMTILFFVTMLIIAYLCCRDKY